MSSPLQDQQNPMFLLLDDALYCEEEHIEEEEELEVVGEVGEESNNGTITNTTTSSFVLVEGDLSWEDEELVSLFSKEERTPNSNLEHSDVIEWILKVNAHYSFSALTAVLAVNYLDRFISSAHFQREKPWMTQLAAVACLSLAAKVEETQVPLLLDLQVEEAKYVFEAKTIQRMELLILSTLQWKMNPVTPLSFLDHIIRRLGLKTHLHWEFMRLCERLLLSVIADSRFACYLPSVLATATMLHVIDQVELANPIEYQNQLMGVLKISQDTVDDCYQLILEVILGDNVHNPNRKRKYQSADSEPGSPNGVIDISFSSDSSNESWTVGVSVSSSPEPLYKRRAQEQQMRLPSFNRVALEVITSPR
ncbi:hypothetical protein GIB67_009051 [Kingdonia uniflora]|uniref:Cyclin D3 n=1 Tax=Kingdonia uniflora TaxID=39325 RepID=A0A7J7P7E5_9MAGN|nr:hypothetical protein GIB67_009051 [Kingdonia uniflora]